MKYVKEISILRAIIDAAKIDLHSGDDYSYDGYEVKVHLDIAIVIDDEDGKARIVVLATDLNAYQPEAAITIIVHNDKEATILKLKRYVKAYEAILAEYGKL